MYQSTLFNILKRINYFKNYLKFKLFTIWRNFNRFKKYLFIRQKLGRKLFMTKPAFVKSLLVSNGQVLKMETIKTHDITSKVWGNRAKFEFDDQQKTVTERAKNDCKNIIETDIFDTLKRLYEDVTNRLKKNRVIDEKENAKTLTELKNKSMFILKQEKKVRKKLIALAERDKSHFDIFVKTVDLMMIELLFQLNKTNFRDIRQEILKDRGKDANFAGIFKLELTFTEAIPELSPTCKDLEDKFRTLFKMIIDCMTEIPRISHSLNKKEIEKKINKDQNNFQEGDEKIMRVDGTEEQIKKSLQGILINSKNYDTCTKDIYSKIINDYKLSFDNISQIFEKFKELQREREKWKIEEYLENKPPTVDEVNKKIEYFDSWLNRVTDIPQNNIKGIFSTDVQSVKTDLTSFLTTSKKILMDYLKEMYKKVKDKIKAEEVRGNSLLIKKKNIAGICEYKEKLIKYEPNLKKLCERCKNLDIINQTIKHFKIELTPAEQDDFPNIVNAHQNLEKKINDALDELAKNKEGHVSEVLKDVENNKSNVEFMRNFLTEPNSVFLNVKTNRETIQNGLTELEKKINDCKDNATKNEYNLKVIHIKAYSVIYNFLGSWRITTRQ